MTLSVREFSSWDSIPDDLAAEYRKKVREAETWLVAELRKRDLKPEVRVYVWDPEAALKRAQKEKERKALPR